MQYGDTLLMRMTEGDETALDEFYGEYRTRILNTARQMVSDEWDAEEVLQDVCWTVFRKAHTFRGDGELWWWVQRVTQNAARMLLRKRRRAPTPIADAEAETMLQASPESQVLDRPEDIAAQRFAMSRIVEELHRLDPMNQELFQAMEVDGMSKEDVAERLSLSISAVKARLHRIRRSLRIAAEGVNEALAG